MSSKVTFTLNGKRRDVVVENNRLLVDLLREDFGLTGTKKSCGNGECGACTVIVNNKAVNSCLVLVIDMDGCEIKTIEGEAINGKLTALQKSFVEHGAVQCGYCSPGMIMSAKTLLNRNESPSENEIKEAIAGNLCRCTGYKKIVKAIKEASNLEKIAKE